MVLIRNNFIAVTGGPGAGKSTLLEALNKKGFRYVGETGRVIIRERIARGLSPRPHQEEFAELMFQRDYNNYITNLNATESLFFDRTFLDSSSFIKKTDAQYMMVTDIVENHRFNNKVIFAPPWEEIYCNDDERDQTFGEAIDTYQFLYNWYKTHGYEPIVLPRTDVGKRVEFVLKEFGIKG